MCATDTPLDISLRNIRYIPRLLNALNCLVYFLIIGDPRGDNLMVGGIFRKLLTELGIQKWTISTKFKRDTSITIEAPLTTAADNKFCDIFSNFRKNKVCHFMNRRFSWNTMPYLLFLKKASTFDFVVCCRIIAGALWVKRQGWVFQSRHK